MEGIISIGNIQKRIYNLIPIDIGDQNDSSAKYPKPISKNILQLSANEIFIPAAIPA